MIDRFEGKSPKSHYISKIQIEICQILYTIYDIYQEKAVIGVWEVYKTIMRKWVKANASVKKEEVHYSLNTSFSRIMDPNAVDDKSKMSSRDLEPIRGKGGKIKPETGQEIRFDEAIGGGKNRNKSSKGFRSDEMERKEKSRDLRGNLNDSGEIVEEGEEEGDDDVIDYKEDEGGANDNNEDEDADNEDNTQEQLNIIQYKEITKNQKKSANAPIKRFVSRYLEGEYTQKAMGDMKELDKDAIVNVLTDMLLNSNPELNVNAMNLLHRHFNQFRLLLTTIDRALIVDEREDMATYTHILTLQHTFEMLVDSARLPKEPAILGQLIDVFLSPADRFEQPGLTELCYAYFWAYKCSVCQRWYRPRVKDLKVRTKENEEEFKKHAQQCMEQHSAAGEDFESIDNYEPTSFDIVAKNQELLRNAKVHITILKFLEKKALHVSNAVRDRYDEMQIDLFNYCFDFIFFFIKNHENNCIALTQKKYMKMFCVFLSHKMFRLKALKILTELIVDNDAANKMISEEDIANLIHDAANSNCSEFCELIDLFKALVESDVRVLKDRQRFIIRKIESYFVNKEGWCSVNELLLIEGEQSATDEELPKLLLDMHKDILNVRTSVDFFGEDYIGFPDQAQKTSDCLLYKHLYFVDLIGLCAKGKNSFTEAFCRKVLSTQVDYISYIYIYI